MRAYVGPKRRSFIILVDERYLSFPDILRFYWFLIPLLIIVKILT